MQIVRNDFSLVSTSGIPFSDRSAYRPVFVDYRRFYEYQGVTSKVTVKTYWVHRRDKAETLARLFEENWLGCASILLQLEILPEETRKPVPGGHIVSHSDFSFVRNDVLVVVTEELMEYPDQTLRQEFVGLLSSRIAWEYRLLDDQTFEDQLGEIKTWLQQGYQDQDLTSAEMESAISGARRFREQKGVC